MRPRSGNASQATTLAFRSDLKWWHLFATCWNDVSFFDCSLSLTSRSIQMRRDLGVAEQSLALIGCNYVAWSYEWSRMDIMVKELVLIVLSCAV